VAVDPACPAELEEPDWPISGAILAASWILESDFNEEVGPLLPAAPQ
jgi:hypothetical protein